MVRELKHTEIGDIPVDWELQTFDETFRVLSNNTLSRENLNNRGGAIRNIHYGDILTKFPEVLDCSIEEIPYINDFSLLSLSTQLLQDGDIVIADTAEDETVGKVTEVQNLGDGKLVPGLHTIPCRVKKGDFAPGWLGYYLNSYLFHRQVLPFVTGIKVSSISKTSISETIIAIPPYDEQREIVAALLEIDKCIKRLEKEIAKKRNTQYGIMEKYLTGKKRLDGFESDWVETTLGQITDIKDGTHQTPHYVEDGIPFYSVETVTTDDFQHVKKISLEEHKKLTFSYKIEKGDVLMTRIGTLGKCKFVDWDVDASFYVSLALLKFRGNTDLARFVAYLSELKMFIKEVDLHSLQYAIPMKINLGAMEEIRVRVPSDIEEIRAINNVFFDLVQNLSFIEMKKHKLSQIKLGMMRDLLTGKIRLV